MGGIGNKALNELTKQPGLSMFLIVYLEGEIYEPTSAVGAWLVDIALSTYGSLQHQAIDGNILKVHDMGVTYTHDTDAQCNLQIGNLLDADKYLNYNVPIGSKGDTLSWIRGDFEPASTAKETDGEVRIRPGDHVICQTPATGGIGSFIPWMLVSWENNNREVA